MAALGKEKVMRFPSSRAITSFIFMVLLIGCDDEKSDWVLDSRFSEDLTISSSNYQALNGRRSQESVARIRVRVSVGEDFDMYSLKELEDVPLYFETRETTLIESFFSAVQEKTLQVPSCYENRDDEIFHILAFNEIDRTAGYFLAIRCHVEERRFFIIHSLQARGSSSIYYSEPLVELFDEYEVELR